MRQVYKWFWAAMSISRTDDVTQFFCVFVRNDFLTLMFSECWLSFEALRTLSFYTFLCLLNFCVCLPFLALMWSSKSHVVNQCICPSVGSLFFCIEAFEAIEAKHTFLSVLPVFHRCFTSTSPVLHQCFTGVSPVFTSVPLVIYHWFTSV